MTYCSKHAEERKRLGLTRKPVRAGAGARMRIIFDYGSDLRQIA